MKAYLIIAQNDYETSTALFAFDKKKDADAFVEECHRYSESRLAFPDTDDNYDEWSKLDEEWKQKHPAGKDDSTAESFYVKEIEIKPGAKGSGAICVQQPQLCK